MKTPTKIPKPKVKKPTAKGVLKVLLNKFGGVVLYTLLFIAIFVGMTFIFGGDNYSMKSYMWTQVLVTLFGGLSVFGLLRLFEWATSYSDTKVLVYTGFLALVGVGIFIISNYTSKIPTVPRSYVWAFLLFVVPLLLLISFEKYLSIPEKIYQGWQYPYGKEVPVIEVINPIKVKFYIAKTKTDDEYAEFALNVPLQYQLGDFMHYFLHRYNYDKNPSSPIYISDDNSEENLYNWLFKKKPNSQVDREVLNPKLSFGEHNIKEGDSIIVERYVAPLIVNEEQVDLIDKPATDQTSDIDIIKTEENE